MRFFLLLGLFGCCGTQYTGGGTVTVSITGSTDPGLDLEVVIPGATGAQLGEMVSSGGAGLLQVLKENNVAEMSKSLGGDGWHQIIGEFDLPEPVSPCGVDLDHLEFTAYPENGVMALWFSSSADGGYDSTDTAASTSEGGAALPNGMPGSANWLTIDSPTHGSGSVEAEWGCNPDPFASTGLHSTFSAKWEFDAAVRRADREWCELTLW